MRDYRLFLFEPASPLGERCARPQPLREAVDAHAIRAADGRRRGRYAELWRDDELVRIFEPD